MRKVLREQHRVLARAAQARIIQPRRLPVEDALAPPPRHVPYRLHRVVRPAELALDADGEGLAEVGDGLIFAVAHARPVRLDDEQRLGVPRGQRVERGGQVGVRGIGAVEGVEGEAEDVPVGGGDEARADEGAEPARLQRDVPPVVDVDHHMRGGGAGADRVGDALTRSLVQRGEAGEVLHERGEGLGVDVDVAGGPEHAVADLVAEGDEGEGHAGAVEGGQRGGDVGAQGGGEGGEGGGPAGWWVLLVGVREGVAEVEVEVDAVAFGVEAGGEQERVREVVVRGLGHEGLGIDPDPRMGG